jgi:hypothetical protein
MRLTLGLETLAGSSRLARSYNAFVAAVKEALWHADTGYVLAAALKPHALPDGTGTFGGAKFDT